MRSKITIFIFGAPGAGKGVTAQTLKEKYMFKHLSMGEYLRQKVFSKDNAILKYKNIIEKGQTLIPCDVVNNIYQNFAKSNLENNCIIDGYPRTLKQLIFLEKYHKKDVDRDLRFLFFEADEDLLLRRLLSRETCTQCLHDYIFEKIHRKGHCNLCGGRLYKRETDNTDSIKQRIKMFNIVTKTILPDIEQRFPVYRIDTNKNIHSIYKDVLNIVNISHLSETPSKCIISSKKNS